MGFQTDKIRSDKIRTSSVALGLPNLTEIGTVELSHVSMQDYMYFSVFSAFSRYCEFFVVLCVQFYMILTFTSGNYF